MSDETPSVTCPQCGRTSYNPNDIKYGYCGNCNAYTGQDHLSVVPDLCPECGLKAPFHEKTCTLLHEARQQVSEEYGFRHPSLFGIRVDRSLVQEDVATPHPGDSDYDDWVALFTVLNAAPLIRDMKFSDRRQIGLHLWRAGYRRSSP